MNLHGIYQKTITFSIVLVMLMGRVSPARDAFKQPFHKTSIWNTPIGSEADYKPANFKDAAYVGVDVLHILELDADDPLRQVFKNYTFGPGRCDSNDPLDLYFNIPDNWIVPDAGNSPYGRTPNSLYAFRLPDSDSLFEGGRMARCKEGGPIYLPQWLKWPNNRKYQSIKGDGKSGGGHGASGMSVMGGTLRMGELVGDGPIRHVIKVNPYAERFLHYSIDVPGYKWPARRADNYAPERYNKNADPDIVMGSLFAIPPDATEESLNLQTPAGKKLFYTMQNYGVYFCEDAAWDTWDLAVERHAEIEFQEKYGYSMKSDTWRREINKLMNALHIIVNNGPESIGGGGEPRMPLLGPFSETIVEADDALLLTDFVLGQNYPNPFNPATTINYTLSKTAGVKLEVFNLQGRLVETLLDGKKDAGTHHVTFSNTTLPSGAYLYKLTAGVFSKTRKMILLR